MKITTCLIACAGLVFATTVEAQPGKNGKGPDGQRGGQGAGHAKHQHHHKNAHALLGAKLKQDGKHALGKFKDRDVTAEVKGGKILAMSAGDIQPKRVRSKTKMVMGPGGFTLASWTPGVLQLAQYDAYDYGYCFDDGYDYDCYWYPADDVAYQDYSWEDYDPTW